MPELPEVETVKETLKTQILGKIIDEVLVYHENTIESPSVDMFQRLLVGEEILDIQRRGKWLVLELNHYYLLSHLRMEGKYFIRDVQAERLKHELVCFRFTDHSSLRYHDTRKFGKMHLIEKGKLATCKPFCKLGLEPTDKALTVDYLKKCYSKKDIPIKTTLLDQSIVVGIGNIYADEILFLSRVNPLKRCCKLTKKELSLLIQNTRFVLEQAILKGGTTIRSYTSSEGVHGLFQNELLVHGKEGECCPCCGTSILKIKVGGRGTYYCPTCQKLALHKKSLDRI